MRTRAFAVPQNTKADLPYTVVFPQALARDEVPLAVDEAAARSTRGIKIDLVTGRKSSVMQASLREKPVLFRELLEPIIG